MDFKHAINRAKQGADSVLDPFLAAAGYNLSVLEGAYRLLDDGDSEKFLAGVIGFAGVIVGGVGITWGNKALLEGMGKIPAIIPKLSDRALQAYHSGQSADLKNWLKTAALVGALGLSIHNAEVTKNIISRPSTTARETSQTLEDRLDMPLYGKEVPEGTEYAMYTGIDAISFDFSTLPSNKEVLTALWDKKFERFKKNGEKLTLYEEEVLGFDEASNHRISLADYITGFDEIISEIRENFAWEEMDGISIHDKRRIYGGNEEEKIRVLKDLAGRITAKDLVAISLKELFPPDKEGFGGTYKAETLDFLLSVRGKQFVDHMPSLHDGLASIGMYQLTPHVVNGKKSTGASGMNRYLPEDMRIPGSISTLESWDHERATYMNLIAGLADAITRLDSATLKHLENMNDEDFKLYLGAIHHMPADARTAVHYWSDNNAELPIIRSMNERLTRYNRQVRNNALGLEAYLRSQELAIQ